MVGSEIPVKRRTGDGGRDRRLAYEAGCVRNAIHWITEAMERRRNRLASLAKSPDDAATARASHELAEQERIGVVVLASTLRAIDVGMTVEDVAALIDGAILRRVEGE